MVRTKCSIANRIIIRVQALVNSSTSHSRSLIKPLISQRERERATNQKAEAEMLLIEPMHNLFLGMAKHLQETCGLVATFSHQMHC